MKEESGMKKFVRGQRMVVQYNDHTCPMCGIGVLRLVTINHYGTTIPVNFECSHCGFTCPVDHNIKDLHKVQPIYDDKISEFIKRFGENTK